MPIFISISTSTSTASQRGASSLENTVSLLVFLLLALVTYESAHWLLLRQALNTALLDTARIAATQQAHPQIIREAFVQQAKKLPAFALKTAENNWSIEKISSTKKTQYDYQALQYEAGNSTIFDDNTLHLRLRYFHRPITPIVRALLRGQNKGHVLIVTDMKVAMQSDQSIWNYPAVTTPPEYSGNNPSEPITTDPLPRLEIEDPITEPSTPPPKPWQPPSPDTPPTENCDGDLCCGPA